MNDTLLNESGLQNHPLTPMSDPDIRRWLAPQTKYAVGHVAMADVAQGADQIAVALEREQGKGRRHIVVDAIADPDLFDIGKAAKDLPLITGGSGVALGLPANFGCTAAAVPWTPQSGKTVILSGSCSNATRAQVAQHAKTNPTREIVPADVIEGRSTPQEMADWLLAQSGTPLAYSSADPSVVRSVQEQFGRDIAAQAIEGFMAQTARAVVAGGATKLICAGGETSGAVVEGLSLTQLEIGPEIDPGVPALRARPDLVVALKSGNFGSDDFFEKAAGILTGEQT